MSCLHLRVTFLNEPVNHQAEVDQLLMVGAHSLAAFCQPGKWEPHLTELSAGICFIIHEIGKTGVILLPLQLRPGHPVFKTSGSSAGRPGSPSLCQRLRFSLELADQVPHTSAWLQLTQSTIFLHSLIFYFFTRVFQAFGVTPIRRLGARWL